VPGFLGRSRLAHLGWRSLWSLAGSCSTNSRTSRVSNTKNSTMESQPLHSSDGGPTIHTAEGLAKENNLSCEIVVYPQQQAAHPSALPSTGLCAHTEYRSGRGILPRRVQPFQSRGRHPKRVPGVHPQERKCGMLLQRERKRRWLRPQEQAEEQERLLHP